MFDNDFRGNQFTQTLNKHLSKEILAINVKFPAEYKDVNDTSKEIFWQSIEKARNNCII